VTCFTATGVAAAACAVPRFCASANRHIA